MADFSRVVPRSDGCLDLREVMVAISDRTFRRLVDERVDADWALPAAVLAGLRKLLPEDEAPRDASQQRVRAMQDWLVAPAAVAPPAAAAAAPAAAAPPSIQTRRLTRKGPSPRDRCLRSYTLRNEKDLHLLTVRHIRATYPGTSMQPGAGELMGETSKGRLEHYSLGYTKGAPDLMLHVSNRKHGAFFIEFKSPYLDTWELEPAQARARKLALHNGYNYLCSNDYQEIVKRIAEHMALAQLRCGCGRFFETSLGLKIHKSSHKKRRA